MRYDDYVEIVTNVLDMGIPEKISTDQSLLMPI